MDDEFKAYNLSIRKKKKTREEVFDSDHDTRNLSQMALVRKSQEQVVSYRK